MLNLGSTTDYKDAIREKIRENSDVYGYQSGLADHCQCQRSYFSKMLADDRTHLSVDQACLVAQAFNFTEDETKYFLDLVQYAKCSTPRAKKHFKTKIDLARDQLNDLRQVTKGADVQTEFQTMYYSSWYWAAIHMAASLTGVRSATDIASRLQLPVDLVKNCLKVMEANGLIAITERGFKLGSSHTHLNRQSMLTFMNHHNWRQRGALTYHAPNHQALHYTVVQTHSQKDFAALREMVAQLVAKNRDVIKDSKDEMVSCLCLDFFPVTNL
jgi:uncharacterized protein (TIGR02147 family)